MGPEQELLWEAWRTESEAEDKREVARLLRLQAERVPRYLQGVAPLMNRDVWAGAAAKRVFEELDVHRQRLVEAEGELRDIAMALDAEANDLDAAAASYRAAAADLRARRLAAASAGPAKGGR